MDGVIFEGLGWRILNLSLGPEGHSIDNDGRKMWSNNDFKNCMEWIEHNLIFYKNYGLSMKHFYEIVHNIPYTKGAQETFAKLREKGYKLALITGGFKNQANKAIRDLKIDHTFAACELFFDDQGRLTHWNILPTDNEGKVDFMRLLIREYKLKPEECAFVGDGENDVFLAKEVGLSIAFNGTKELQEVCTHSINQKEKDLRAILEFL